VAAVLFWSVIAAAFIGPGTVTACGAAGSEHGLTLLWALTFSGVACFTLQEAAARVAVASGKTLAGAIRDRARTRGGRTASVLLVAGAIVVGCAAYEAGNLAGAVTGVGLLAPDVPAAGALVALAVLATALLASGKAPTVARVMGTLVAVMAVAFVATSVRLDPDWTAVARGALLPTPRAGAAIAILGLVGTTVVPYNLFLGSGLAGSRPLGETRFGLAVAIGLGVLVSMAIVVVGTSLHGAFTLEALSAALALRLGAWAGDLFAVGLLAAGFTSAVTAPLAAALTAGGLAGDSSGRSRPYHAVWAGVLLTGTAFGLAGFRPVPLILAVQAANGVLLPFVAVFLWVVVNDRTLLGERINGRTANVVFGTTVWITVSLGVLGVLRAASAAVGRPPPGRDAVLVATAAVTVALAWPVARTLARARAAA